MTLQVSCNRESHCSTVSDLRPTDGWAWRNMLMTIVIVNHRRSLRQNNSTQKRRQCCHQFLPHAVNCGRFCFWRRQSVFFVCVRNISGTAERICAKFTWKMCLVPRSDEFEGQRAKVKVTRDKNGIFRPFRRLACGLCSVKHL